MSRKLSVAPSRPKTVREWDGGTLILLSNEEIDVLTEPEKSKYIARLHAHMLDFGREESPWFKQWKDFDRFCREDGCESLRFDPHMHCPKHLDLDTIDPENAVRRRRISNQLRLAELADKAVDEMEKVLAAGEEIPAAVRMKVADSILDRAGVPRHTANSVQIDAEVRVSDTGAAEVIKARLDRLAPRAAVEAELAGIEEATLSIEEGD
jgi:hypothetical protein